MIAFHKAIIRVHKENKEFKTGSIKWMLTADNMIGYARFTKDNHSVILINNNGHEMTKELSVWELGIPKQSEMTRLIITGREGYDTEHVTYQVTAGKITVTMPPSSGVILQHKNKPVRKQEDLKTNEKTNGKNFLQFQ